MKRVKGLLLFATYLLGSFSTLFSQIPIGYYDSADEKTGDVLKTALYNIIKGHTEYPYSSSSTDVWDILKETDKDTSNPENVILFYTGWSVNAAQEFNNESGWNREHVWAKSRGDFGTSSGPGTDAHHLRPTDITVNNARANRWFDTCSTPYFDAGLETGCFLNDSRWAWQPRDEVKGDVARMIFYMATRYEGENGEPDLEIIDSFPSDDYTKDPVHAKLSALLAWHEEDPVDEYERNRNEVIYGFQNNRNPFIDHPEYVDGIWRIYSDPCDTIAPFQEAEICIVTLNSSNKYIIVWEKTYDQGIAHYNIYQREAIENYALLGSVPFDSLSVFVDTLSQPDEYPHFYKISVTDLCGNESELSPYHTSMYLQTSMGIGGEINLSWTAYEGFDYEEYNILRGSHPDSLYVITSVPSGFVSWTDINPISGHVYYQIEVTKPESCIAIGPDTIEFVSSYTVVSEEYIDPATIQNSNFNSELVIYPNPFIEKVTISFPNPNREEYLLVLRDLTGKVVRQINDITDNQVVIRRNNLPPGLYIIELIGKRSLRGKVVLE